MMPTTPCKQPLRVSIAGPIGSGKTLLIHGLSKWLWPAYNLAVATVENLGNSLWSSCAGPVNTPGLTKDAAFLLQQGILPQEHIRSIAQVAAISELGGIPDLELVFVEHGGNDLTAVFNAELVDKTVYVVDIASGKEVICRGGTGLVHSDLLILNKADLAPYFGISLAELAEEIRQQRGDRPFVFTNLQGDTGLDEVVRWLELCLFRVEEPSLRQPAEERTTGKDQPALIEEQWFWRYKMSRGAHTHFNPAMRKKPLSSAPMSAAPLRYTDDGEVAWDQLWTDFCDLAAIGGPPHRGTLLEPVSPAEARSDPDAYAQVVAEIERGISLVTGLTTLHSAIPGWVGVECEDEMMAIWLQQAILAENVSVRRDESKLYLPAGPGFQLKAEIKNVITAIAKTHHYWQEHMLWQRGESV
jgi:urease accessory protein UreG